MMTAGQEKGGKRALEMQDLSCGTHGRHLNCWPDFRAIRASLQVLNY
jgi:hypothetical protein